MNCNIKRIETLIEKLATFTEKDDKGFTRFSYTELDLAAKQYIIEKMKEINLEISMDLVGNIFARREGMEKDLPPILVGSHLDTVRNGGKYDGIAGVVSALEIMKIIEENKVYTKHPIEVVIFAEEEGGRFNSALVGSRWLAGQLNIKALENLKDGEGINVYQASRVLEVFNKDVQRYERKEKAIKAFFELHCEQGPVLQFKQKNLGIVNSITGSSCYEVILTGQSDHAGTTPMKLRKDAFHMAAKASVELNEYISKLPGEAVGTIGYIEINPNVYNIVPEKATFTMDIRSHSKEMMDDIIQHMKVYIQEICLKNNVKYAINKKHHVSPMKLSKKLVDLLINNAKKRKYDYMEMGSGAGHDALIMASITDTVMVFVPSKDGRSHCPEEFSSVEDIAKGANVLLDTIINLAEPINSL